MNQYHKIYNVFERDRTTRKLILDNYTLPEFRYLKDCDWAFQEKIDGTNIRIIWNGETIIYKGKSEDAEIPTFLLSRLWQLFDHKKQMFSELFGTKEVCIYGEGYGNKIQKVGKLYLPNDVDFIAFDIKVGNYWLPREDAIKMFQAFDIEYVPITHCMPLTDMIDIMLHEPQPTSFLSENAMAEGWVGKPLIPLYSNNGRIVVKLKYVDFEKLK
jgi:ATP-dependent RNA circularization protein (DNA/RNA ligase family)